MDLLAVLVGDDGALSGTGVSTKNDTVGIHQADNRCTGLCRFGSLHALLTQGLITNDEFN